MAPVHSATQSDAATAIGERFLGVFSMAVSYAVKEWRESSHKRIWKVKKESFERATYPEENSLRVCTQYTECSLAYINRRGNL